MICDPVHGETLSLQTTACRGPEVEEHSQHHGSNRQSQGRYQAVSSKWLKK